MKLILRNSNLVFERYKLDDDAIALMGKYTRSLTETQRKAVNNLVISLKNAGVYNRLTAAYFPCLAGTINEVFFDAVTDTQFDTSQQNVYVLDANGVGSVFDSTHMKGIKVNTNLNNSIESIFASLYEVGEGSAHTSSGINFKTAIGGCYPKISDHIVHVFPNTYSTPVGAKIPDVEGGYCPTSKHYSLSWRYTVDESTWHTANADFCFEGESIQLTPVSGSSDGTQLDDTWGADKMMIGSQPNMGPGSGSYESRCAMVLVMAASTTTERDAVNAAVKAFNIAFWSE